MGKTMSDGKYKVHIPKGIPVLCYHNVSNVTTKSHRLYILSEKKFSRQISWLKKGGYQAISLNALCDYLDYGIEIPQKSVVITFDDGYLDLKETVTPLLAKMKYCHTFFLNTNKLGKTTDWANKAVKLPILSDKDIREMSHEYGEYVSFQAHGKDHLDLSKLSQEMKIEEVVECINSLKLITNNPVQYLAYPYGKYDGNTPEIMRTFPIRGSFTTDQGLCRPGQDFHLLPRIEIFSSDLFIDFICKVKFGWGPIASIRRNLKKLYKKITIQS